MIDHLNNLLRHVMMVQVRNLRPTPEDPPEAANAVLEEQVRFQPPDDEWRTHVSNLQRPALNIYLVDLRENRKLRSNARIRTVENGLASEQQAPGRVDCHYLITAWSPAVPSPAVEPAMDEHTLLYEVTGVMVNNAPLNPSRLYPPDSVALETVPLLIRDCDLPTEILPVEGFPKLAEFWGAMGANHRWKPAVYLVVTLPVALPTQIAGPLVTTRITEYRRTGRPETAETLIQIGGHVLDAINPDPDTGIPVPVLGAWVRLETTDGRPLQTTETNALGRFTFNSLPPGQFQLNWRAEGLPIPTPRLIDVPSPTGEYDLTFA